MKKIFYTGLLSINLFALDINEAVDLALKNNHELKEQNYGYEESLESVNIQKGSFLPRVDVGYSFTNRDKTIISQTKKDSTLSATISYNLFNGLSDKYFLDSSKYSSQYTKYMLEAKKFDTVLNTKIAYVDFLIKKSELLTKIDAFTLFRKQFEDATNQFAQGIIARNDLLQIEVEMLQSKQSVQEARRALEVARLTLSNITSSEIKEEMIVEELKLDESKTYDEFEYDNRDEIKAINMLLQSYKSYKDGLDGSYYPKVDATHSIVKYGDDIGVDGKTGYPDTQNITGVTISWNLYNGGKDESSSLVYSKKISALNESLLNIKQNISLQYKSAMLKLEVSKLNLESAKLSLSQSELNYEIVNNRFKEGIAKSTELIDANYLLTKSKESYNKAYYDKFISIATLDRVTQKAY